MKIGVISDIHCNASALRRVLEEMPPVDHLLCAGDLVNQYGFSNEVFDLVDEFHIQFIQGNHEDTLLNNTNRRIFTQNLINPSHLEKVSSAPDSMELLFNGTSILMVHGSPWDHLKEYIFPNSYKLKMFEGLGFDIVIMGHTHIPMVKKIGEVILLNPGSCSAPRDGDPRSSYAIIDTHHREVYVERSSYNVEQESVLSILKEMKKQ
ncbi:MAG: metallophosphoesterase family protein [Candidatus Tectomicrobia bacterium]|nr:metallophosphoesterase family protein [Candidatus Tectomicrobia bacterium]